VGDVGIGEPVVGWIVAIVGCRGWGAAVLPPTWTRLTPSSRARVAGPAWWEWGGYVDLESLGSVLLGCGLVAIWAVASSLWSSIRRRKIRRVVLLEELVNAGAMVAASLRAGTMAITRGQRLGGLAARRRHRIA